MSKAIGVGILGFGAMGRTHAEGYLAATRASLRGVAGKRPGGWEGGEGVVWYDDVEPLLAREDIHAVSICTYTDSHVALALRALELGKHVLVEKPVALRSADVARLAEAAGASGLVCMPAMCMRFWSGWPWLREQITSGDFGAVRRATFTRLASQPTWGVEFYRDDGRSGGALFDLHVHDVDFLRWCFGDPIEVSSAGTSHDITTGYRFSGSPMDASARGAWLPDPAAPFTMRYEVEFGAALVRFDLARNPTVRIERNGGVETVELPRTSAYTAEVAHFLDLIEGRAETPVVTMEDAVAVTRILEAEAASLRLGGSVAPDRPGR